MPNKSAQSRVDAHEQFGAWTIIGVGKPRKNCTQFICRCLCKTVRTIPLSNLLSGRSTCCQKCGSKHAAKKRHARAVAKWAARGITVGHNCHYRVCQCGRRMWVKSTICRHCQAADPNRAGVKYPRPLAAVGSEFGVSRERIRQVVAKLGWDGMLQYFSMPRIKTGRPFGPSKYLGTRRGLLTIESGSFVAGFDMRCQCGVMIHARYSTEATRHCCAACVKVLRANGIYPGANLNGVDRDRALAVLGAKR